MTDSRDASNFSDNFQQVDRVIDDLREEVTLNGSHEVSTDHGSDELLSVMRMLTGMGRQESDEVSGEEAISMDVQLGDYRILREVGRGGMGQVFEAMQISLTRRVALKVLSLGTTPLDTARDDEKVARFDREAQAAASLEHPHIVRAYARGKHRGVYYLAMQFIDGQNLAEFIRERRADVQGTLPVASDPADVTTGELCVDEVARLQEPHQAGLNSHESGNERRQAEKAVRNNGSDTSSHLSSSSLATASYFRDIARIGQQAAEALQYAHENQVIHRDIKPSNLILDTQGNVHIADFGLAALGNSIDLTATGNALGTLRYSSPEQSLGSREVDARTDVYSLGVTLYELATLSSPFSSDQPASLLYDIQEREPLRPRKIAPKLPSDLESIILKAMSKSVRHRYQTAVELAADLQRFLRHEPVHAKQPTRIGHTIRWVQRNRMVSSLGSVAVLLALSVAFSVTNVWSHKKNLQQALIATDEFKTQVVRQSEEQQSVERHLREVQYVADLRDSHRAWKDRDLPRAKRLLRKYIPTGAEPDLRGFAWRRLWKLCHQECLAELKGHQGAVYHVAFSPDGKILASSSKDETINLWDIKTKSLVGTLRGHTDEVNHIRFSKDGTMLVSGSDDRTVRVWDVASRKTIATLTGNEERVFAVAISPDGKTVVSGACDHTIRVFDLPTQTTHKVIREHTDLIQDLNFSPDGKTLASVSDDFRLILWDTDSFTKRFSQVDENSRLFCTTFSHSGDLVITSGATTPIRIWDAHTGSQRTELLGGTVGNSVTFSPDDRLLGVAHVDGIAQVINLRTREQVSLFHHAQEVADVAFSKDGSVVATACFDGIVRLWSLPQSEPNVRAFTLDWESQTLAMCSADGEMSLRDWDATSSRESFRTGWDHGHLMSMRLSPGGRKLVRASGDEVEFFDLSTRKLALHDDFSRNDACIAFSSDGKFLAEGGEGGIRLLAPSDGRPTEILVEGIHVISLIFSADAQTLLAGCADGTVKVWEMATRSQIGNIHAHTEGVKLLALTADGKAFVTGGWDAQIRLWDIRTHALIWEIESHAEGIDSFAVSPDGRTLAGGGRDGVLKLWSLATQQLLFNYQTGAQAVTHLTFSGDGNTLLFTTVNAPVVDALHLWHAATNDDVSRDLKRSSADE
jgi:eukaryotic-like serine/threonine-protein kinase